MTQALMRSKHQRGARCIHRDLTARELDRIIDTQAELLAALKAIADMKRDAKTDDAQLAALCIAIAKTACSKAEGE